MTLEDIKYHMLDYMDKNKISYTITTYRNKYDMDGYCSRTMYNDIISFWKNFNSEKHFMYVVSGAYATGDLDLDGGRDYILSRSNVIPLLFDYLYNTMKFSLKDYKSIIYNTTDISDEIEDYYNNTDVIRDSKINNILN